MVEIALSRYLGLKFESDRQTGAYGTDPNAGSTAYSQLVFTDVGEISVNPSNEFLTAPSSTRDGDRTALGAFKAGGSIRTVADCYMAGYWLYGALGTCQADLVESGAGSSYGHLFYPVQGRERLPSWVIVSGLDGKLEKVYTGSAMKSITLSAAKGGLLEMSQDFMYQKETIGDWGDYGTDEENVTLDDDANIMSFVHGTITKLGGVSKPVESFSVTVNNNPDDDWFILGSRFLQGVHENDRTIEGSITISVQDATEIKRFLAGGSSPTATSPGSTYTPFTLEMVFNTATSVFSGSTDSFQMGMWFPEVVYTNYTLAASTRNRLTYDVSFKALKGQLTWTNGTIVGSSLPAANDTSYDDEVTYTPMLGWIINSKSTDYAGVAA